MYIIGIYLGSILHSNVVWDISGIANALMTIPNLYMIYCLVDDILPATKNKYKKK
jgi:Na+/alanine symporter